MTNTTRPDVLIDLRGAYDKNSASLPDIESVINQLIKTAGRSLNVTVLRENLELVYSANVFNLLTAIKAGGEEGDYLRIAFLKIAAPDRVLPPQDLSKLRGFSDSTQDLFTWIINYRRQPEFNQEKLTALLDLVDTIQEQQELSSNEPE